MGPVWMHAKELSGMTMQQNIWMRDPPSSSYPACIAVKCAFMQSDESGEIYLRLLREAIMIRGENISQQKILNREANKLQGFVPGFDMDQFTEDIKNGNGMEAFRKDLQEVQYYHINRFPSLVIKNEQGKAIIISGYRPYNVLMSAIQQVSDISSAEESINMAEYKLFWPFYTERELKEIY